MKTELQKAWRRASWQSFALILTTLSGVLTMPEVKELVEMYPTQLAFIGAASVIVMGLTKIVNNYLELRKELSKFE